MIWTLLVLKSPTKHPFVGSRDYDIPPIEKDESSEVAVLALILVDF